MKVPTHLRQIVVPEAVCETAETHLTTYRQWNASLEDAIKQEYSRYTFAFDADDQVWRHNVYEAPNWKVHSVTQEEYILCRQTENPASN